MNEARRLGGRYELLEPIGIGGMAVVWRGRDVRLRRDVAIKILRPELAADRDLVARFEREARHAGHIAHPNIVAVFDVGQDGPDYYIVMELVDGPSLARVLAAEGVLDPRRAVGIAIEAADALHAAHERGIVHRDVKPGNLLVDRGERVRLADFGIARALASAAVTVPGTVLGSVPYLSPEQARGEEATAASDQFSLGVVLFEMLTGQHPWTGDTPGAVATARLHRPPPAASEVGRNIPRELDEVVGRALRLEPSQRYPGVGAFADALRTWAGAAGHPRGATGSAAGAAAFAGAGSGAAGPAGPAPDAGTRPSRDAPAREAQTERSPVARSPRPAAAAGPASGGGGRGRWRGARDSRQVRRDAGLAILALSIGLVLLGGAAFAGLLGQDLPGRGDRVIPGGLDVTPVPSPDIAGEATPVPSPDIVEATPMPVEPTPEAPPEGPTPVPEIVTPPPPTPPPASPPPPPAEPPAATPLAPVTAIDRPDDAVRAFYEAVVAGDWALATALWSPEMQQAYPPDEYIVGRFTDTTRIELVRLQVVELDEEDGEATVAVELVEHRAVGTSPRRFIGSWDLVWREGAWLLDDPEF
jgi:eukaryotic-like serine/threonine-protein kinase